MGLEIQGSINQILEATARGATAYAFSPKLQQKKEIKSLTKVIEKMEAGAEKEEKAYKKAGYSPEEAQVKTHPTREKVIEQKRKLAHITGKDEDYENIGYDVGMIQTQQEEFIASQLAKQVAKEKKENDAIEKGLEKVARDEKTAMFIKSVLQGTPSEFEGPKVREVLK